MGVFYIGQEVIVLGASGLKTRTLKEQLDKLVQVLVYPFSQYESTQSSRVRRTSLPVPAVLV
eukprot:1719375-Rhodomonas_salina.1